MPTPGPHKQPLEAAPIRSGTSLTTPASHATTGRTNRSRCRSRRRRRHHSRHTRAKHARSHRSPAASTAKASSTRRRRRRSPSTSIFHIFRQLLPQPLPCTHHPPTQSAVYTSAPHHKHVPSRIPQHSSNTTASSALEATPTTFPPAPPPRTDCMVA